MKRKLNLYGVLIIGFLSGVVWVAACGGGGSVAAFVADALDIGYDPTSSGLQLSGSAVTNVQDAIDALDASLAGGNVSYDKTASGLDATTIQAAIDEIVTEMPTAYSNDAAVAAVTTADIFLRRDQDDDSTRTITAEGFTLGTPKTGYATVIGAAFIPDVDTTVFGTTNSKRNRSSNGTSTFHAPVFLPHGATITKLTTYIDNNDATETGTATVILKRLSLSTDSGADDTEAIATTATEYEEFTKTDDSMEAGKETVNNNTYAYFLTLSITDNSAPSIEIHGAKIDYTYTDF